MNEEQNETMHIEDEGACKKIADKIKKIRAGNRLMASQDMNVSLSFYHREQPEKRCGVLKLNGAFDFSILDVGIALGAICLMGHILGAVASFFRHRH